MIRTFVTVQSVFYYAVGRFNTCIEHMHLPTMATSLMHMVWHRFGPPPAEIPQAIIYQHVENMFSIAWKRLDNFLLLLLDKIIF